MGNHAEGREGLTGCIKKGVAVMPAVGRGEKPVVLGLLSIGLGWPILGQWRPWLSKKKGIRGTLVGNERNNDCDSGRRQSDAFTIRPSQSLTGGRGKGWQ